MEQFGFIIHPLGLQDVTKKFPLAKKIPDNILKRVIYRIPPFKVSEITGVASSYGEAKGHFIAVPLLPEQLLNLPLEQVQKKIIKSCQMAASMGAKIVGLGAFTSVVGDKGISIAKQLKIPVTTGNTYTVAIALESVEKACKIMGKDFKNSEIVIIGANGSIGKTCARILAREVKYLSLVSRNLNKLEEFAEEILMETGLSVHISNQLKGSLERADVVITVSSSADVVIQPEFLKRGAIVCDVARPRDVSAKVVKERKDVVVIEGGLVEVPGDVNFNFNFGLPSKTCYACMAETMILALEGKYENYSCGSNLEAKKVLEISRLAKKHGFKLAGFRSFDKPLKYKDILEIKQRTLNNAV